MTEPTSDKAGILDLIKVFMVEQGFQEDHITIEERYGIERTVLSFRTWGFAVLKADDKLVFLPFKTNYPVDANPADPNFFDVLKQALELPERGHPWFKSWFRSYGPVAQKSGARDS